MESLPDKALSKGLNKTLSEDQLTTIYTYFNEINIIAQLSSAVFERGLPEGLTLSQFSVLSWFIRVDSIATPGRLATAFMVTKGAMTNTLKKLASKGLINVNVDEKSARRKIVTLTPEGRKMQKLAIKQSYIALREIGAEVAMQDFIQPLASLRNVREVLDAKRY